MDKKVRYFRTDGNQEIGIGHIMRCLSIAEAFRKRGDDSVFIVADEAVENMIKRRCFRTICLNTKWNCLDFETDVICREIQNRGIDALILDSYFVSQKYLEKLSKITKTVYIDDLNSFIYPVNLLINYNIYAPEFNYRQRYKAASLKTEFALGCKYVPLRDKFVKVSRKTAEKVKKIFITTGGTDKYNVAGKLLEKLRMENWFAETDYYVIIGKFNVNKENLARRWKDCGNVYLLYDVNDISLYMKECDLAITAGGVTVYELMACGIPSVSYIIADNQLNAAKTLSRQNLIACAGDVRSDLSAAVDNVVREIVYLRNDVSLRNEISRRMQDTVDGLGSQRLAQIISNI